MRRFSIKSKLIIMLLGVSLASVLTVAFLAYRNGTSALTESVFERLTSVRASKAYQLESFLDRVRSHVETLGEDHMVARAMVDFGAAFAALDRSPIPKAWDESLDAYYRDEFLPRLRKNVDGSPVFEAYRPTQAATRYLQYQYVSANENAVGEKLRLDDPGDGSRYSAVHAEYHPIFRNLVEEFGYYDMFLIDSDSGSIVYSVYKETDFATSLRDGPYSNTNFAAVTQKIRETPDKHFVRMIDFAPYRPSYAAPAAFIATPIYHGTRNVGILAFQLPIDEINRIMTGNRNWESDGLGRTGESYVVGPDRLMRSVSRFLIEDSEGYARALRASGVPDSNIERIQRLGTSILQQEVRTEASAEAMRGTTGTRIVDDYRGVQVLSSFAPLAVPDVSWVILSEMDIDEAYEPVDAFARTMIISAVVLILAVTLLAMLLASSFVAPIEVLAEGARRVGAGESQLHIDAGSNDELGELAESFNQMLASVRSQTDLVEQKNRENEDLLLNVLPKPIAKRLKAGEENIADSFDNVTVLFSDLVGFTDLLRTLPPHDSVSLLNEIVSSFDEAAERRVVEKIKTIGDGYMAASGLVTSQLDHAKRAIDLALDMMGIVRRVNNERGLKLELRIGINSGPLVAGVIGRNKFLYDLWGRTVNAASNLMSAALPGEVFMTAAVADSVKGLYPLEPVERDGVPGYALAGDAEAAGMGRQA